MDNPHKLTALELRVLKLYQAGHSDSQISAETGMAESTVEDIVDKLDGLGYHPPISGSSS